ncbi:DUF2007 domain-containing protein [Bartonella tamiae]|uniref:DUF2007 domain-containing protein n=1 Tax=Bartonella tamiae Th239 TaxID=1094558 RepID=J1K0G8_9HYPH|nr:DUF2007 domain-containing protein [Bartonella tamiae]EJF90500.1 hypothetical protein ME5_00901 [Bartonella tamiae Th239]EJF93556.1 hypothetical protein MEG_00980 [Bartonella tamiae Th307]
MIELIRTNDIVLLSFVESLMKEADIIYFIADCHTSMAEGSMGFLQRRLMVDERRKSEARKIIIDVGLAHELRTK